MADDPYLIRRMGSGEWRELRAIRLEAVRDTPTAFSSSYAELASHPDVFWQERAAAGATSGSGATFIASDRNDDWVGSASAEPLAEVPDHAHIHAVYVRAGHRGPTGLGGRLMEAAIRFAEQHIDVSRLTLGVHENNTRALAFYRRIPVAVARPARTAEVGDVRAPPKVRLRGMMTGAPRGVPRGVRPPRGG
jgi:ribosomal protein S18 acetylase RimI-like enzyme